ncbi:hypothetical protein MASR1M31_06940 [Porphyromonadaceae bacterium]
MLHFAKGGIGYAYTPEELRGTIFSVLEKLGPKKEGIGHTSRLYPLALRAGEITRYIYEFYGEALTDILPALGTHFPMEEEEIEKMFTGVPKSLFREHKWRDEVVTVGIVQGSTSRRFQVVRWTTNGLRRLTKC